jgi:squalene-hopene/tetraprenyl-beta-curcumene cyclase
MRHDSTEIRETAVAADFAQVLKRDLDLRREAQHAVSRAAAGLAAKQHPDGFWCGELLADVSLEADFIVLETWLSHGTLEHYNRPDRIRKAAHRILSQQGADGGWPIFPGGEAEVNTSVKAYAALKLAGMSPDLPALRKGREKILELGGIQACNSYTRINLSFLDLFPARFTPTIPPEMILLPGGSFYPGGMLYEMASWTRAIVIPLSIAQATGEVRPTPDPELLKDIYHPYARFSLPKRDRIWSSLFHQLDRFFKIWERRGLREVRIAAIRQAERWVLDRMRSSEGVGAIYPSMMYTIMALEALEYPKDHPSVLEARAQFEKLITETDTELYFQPCFSPTWDTAYSVYVLGRSGQATADSMRRAADWLLEREIRNRGDWVAKRPYLPPSGWAFEFLNDHYPDIDDTAMVLLGLMHARSSDPDRQATVEARALGWLRGMQSRDGGFAAFDADNDWSLLNSVPFSDHNAMLDPTCPDITGRTLSCLGARGATQDDAAVSRAVAYLLRTQEEDGTWYGRWGVAYIYGTFLALGGLRAVGFTEEAVYERAAQKILSVQNTDGGWGESCRSYNNNVLSPAQSTASQTAWALLALQAAGYRHSPAYLAGIRYLLERQTGDGTWVESEATGTGFPKVFYLRYTLYAQYFPLMALAEHGWSAS